MPFIFTAILSLFLISSASCQTTDSLLIDDLNQTVKPIASFDPEDNFQDILFMKAPLKDAKVLGLGESTHGTPLFDSYRRRLIRFFVSELGYKAIIDEGDILAAEKIDEYINCKTDTITYLGGLRPAVLNKKELNWLRAYNSAKSEAERVHIYGAEVRGFRNILSKLASLMPTIDKADQQTISTFSFNTGINYSGLSKADFKALNDLAGRLKATCNSAQCRYYQELLSQLADFAYRARFGREPFNTRDRYMFDNVKAVVSGTSGNKAIVLAHNGHIQKTGIEGTTSLGYLLNQQYGNTYFTIGTDFNTGDVLVYDTKSKRYITKNFSPVNENDAIEFYFGQCRYPNFIFPVKNIEQTKLVRDFVNRKIKIRRNIDATGGFLKSPLTLADNYDYIVFINNTGKN